MYCHYSSQRRLLKNYRRQLRFEEVEKRCMLASFMVTSSGDAIENTAAAAGTLRQAIFDANRFPDPDTIQFASSLSDAKITLTQGELFISESVTIDGTVDGVGPSQVLLNITIDANGGGDGVVGDFDGFRIFNIQDADQVEINGLTLTGGDAGFGLVGPNGGGITAFNTNLMIENSLSCERALCGIACAA